MFISSNIFDAYLHCATKCWLISRGEVGSNNVYAEWARENNQVYRVNGIFRISSGLQRGNYVAPPPRNVNFKAALWKFAFEVTVSCKELESCIHAVERLPPEVRGNLVQFVPIRFVANNKLLKSDKLLIAFEAHILSETLRREITYAKIIHGDGFSSVKVKTTILMGEVKKIIGKINALLTDDAPPDLILNRHCPECEYHRRCRDNAIEKDDLSLLGGMTEKERKKLNGRGILTVKQLSYTFRPRKRPKGQRVIREKYHHSLKALAIRENKIHIVGSSKLIIEGHTLVYLDVEGLPDREFYYLIGLRVRHGDSVLQHSLWAAGLEEEEKIWREFLELLTTIDNPVLLHYGSYETTFIKVMSSRYGTAVTGADAEIVFPLTVNILSVIYGHVYFPVVSNGLKDIASFCGFQWSEKFASGLQTVVWRGRWENTREDSQQKKLILYNAEDCEALDLTVETIQKLVRIDGETHKTTPLTNVTYVDDLKPVGWPHVYGKTAYICPEFSYINECAYWDYQRSRIYIRSAPNLKKTIKVTKQKKLPFNEIVGSILPPNCPTCGQSKYRYNGGHTKNYIDLRFSAGGIKRWISRYIIRQYKCKNCNAKFSSSIPDKLKKHQRYGLQLQAYVIFNIIELHIPMLQLSKIIEKYYGITLLQPTIGLMKNRAAKYYQDTFESIKNTLLSRKVIHADETRMNLRDKSIYVWVFTSMEEVVYIWSESREADVATSFLENFEGVLISDFYSAYDSVKCQQQRCLIHLIRDLNEGVLQEPFNEELKMIAFEFADLLKPIISTIDRFGLKHHYLNKHKSSVKKFFDNLFFFDYKTESARKVQVRFKKNELRLFKFLDHDNVPWNNNNAEHAVKFISKLRDTISGRTTENGIEHYLTLLSICETCKYQAVDFLDFLRSGEKNIGTFTRYHRQRVHTNIKLSSQRIKNINATTYKSECVIE